MNENQTLFAEALKLFVNNSLLNDIGWEPFSAIAEGGLATVEIGLVNGHLKIASIECANVISIEKELKQAKRRIRQLESQIETQTPTQEETVVTEVTDEPKLTRTRRKS